MPGTVLDTYDKIMHKETEIVVLWSLYSCWGDRHDKQVGYKIRRVATGNRMGGNGLAEKVTL